MVDKSNITRFLIMPSNGEEPYFVEASDVLAETNFYIDGKLVHSVGGAAYREEPYNAETPYEESTTAEPLE